MKVRVVDKEKTYDATYYFGNTVVHVVAPESKTPEEIEKILEAHHKAGWEIWNDILEREGKKTNKV